MRHLAYDTAKLASQWNWTRMPQEDENKFKKSNVPAKAGESSWLTTPTFIRHIFDKFPLVTHPLNELPHRQPIERNENTLYIFAPEGDAQRGAPSFNPSCLKWQVRQPESLVFPVAGVKAHGKARPTSSSRGLTSSPSHPTIMHHRRDHYLS